LRKKYPHLRGRIQNGDIDEVPTVKVDAENGANFKSGSVAPRAAHSAEKCPRLSDKLNRSCRSKIFSAPLLTKGKGEEERQDNCSFESAKSALITEAVAQ
jgi:hypothetical protein